MALPFAVVLLAALLSPAASARERPNVLVISGDDHAAYVTGAYGNKLVRTPAIDRLAAGGIRFNRAYCNSPVCTASRQSFLTGRFPRSIGVTRLETALRESEVTLADTFSAAGYETAAIGKMHFNSPLAHGFGLRVDLPQYRDWLAQQPPEAPTSDVLVQPPWRPFKDPARLWLNSDCRPMDKHDARTEGSYLAARAVEFLQAERDKPFFLMVNFYEPHSPFRFPLEFRDRHQPAEFTVPPVPEGDKRQIPAVFSELTDEQKQGIAAAYYTSVAFLDQNVGRVLDGLAQSGRADNTIVIYLSDHGYLLGQHGRFEKHCSFEEAVRVPLVVRYPGHVAAGATSEALVELVDLAPTLYELCECQTTAPLDGRSLAPLLAGKGDELREHVIVEYAPNDEVMIRDRRWKLIYERGVARRTDGYDVAGPLVPHEFRLYDLENDPHEAQSVAHEPAHAAVVERLTGLLVEHLVTTAREPELIPKDVDRQARLDYCVQSRDVPKEK